MRYIFQLLPKEPLCSQLQELRQHLSSLIGHNKALNYPLPHVTLLHSIADNSVNAIQAGDQLIATLPSIRDVFQLTLASRLIDISNPNVTLSIKDSLELGQIRDTLRNEISQLEQQGQLSSSPIAESMPHITLAQDISPENQVLARDYIKQNVNWLPEVIEFDRVVLLARDVALNQPYSIVASILLKPVSEQ